LLSDVGNAAIPGNDVLFNLVLQRPCQLQKSIETKKALDAQNSGPLE